MASDNSQNRIPRENNVDGEWQSVEEDDDVMIFVPGAFHRFYRLPVELQTAIWYWYGIINAETPNLIRIYRKVIDEIAQGPLREDDRRRQPITIKGRLLQVAYKIPPILLICKLSNEVGEKLYEQVFQKIPMGGSDIQLTYYNEAKDVIYLGSVFILQEWRYNRRTQLERTFHSHNNPAIQEITDRINMKHLVIDGLIQSRFMWKLLGRFYDCETIMVATAFDIDKATFCLADAFQEDRELLYRLRGSLTAYWQSERQGQFVLRDYRGKPIRHVIALPNWDPSESTISNPILLFQKPTQMGENGIKLVRILFSWKSTHSKFSANIVTDHRPSRNPKKDT